jgi:hypothetical protein
VHKSHKPIAAFGLGDANNLTADGLADEHKLAAPLNLAVMPYAAHLVGGVIHGIVDALWIRPGRRGMHASGRSLPERFVGPFRVEFVPHAIKPGLLLPRRGRRRSRGLVL